MSTSPIARSKPSLTEIKRRLVFTLLKPAVRLSRQLRLELAAVEELCRMAYFEEVRVRGRASQAQTAALMGKSLRTVGKLEMRYREGFLVPETALEQTREVEDALDDDDGATLEQVKARVPHLGGPEVERLLESLAEVGRVVRDGSRQEPRYRLNTAFVSLVRDDLDAQLDGLLHQLDVITAAVRARFFKPGQRPALARTLSFVSDADSMEDLGDGVVMELRRRCIETEERALKRGVRERYAVTFVLAPLPERQKD